jgi:hypothetical protein
MINPHLITPKYKRVNSFQFAGGHKYFPLLNHFTRRSFRRASEAKEYAERVHARWCRLYLAAVWLEFSKSGQMASPEPAKEPA